MGSVLINALAVASAASDRPWTSRDEGEGVYLNSEPPGRYAQVWIDPEHQEYRWELWVKAPGGGRLHQSGFGTDAGQVLADAERALSEGVSR